MSVKLLLSICAFGMLTSCASGSLISNICSAEGFPPGSHGFDDCYDRHHFGGGNVDNAALLAAGAKLMQGPPRPAVTTVMCTAYTANTVGCMGTTQ